MKQLGGSITGSGIVIPESCKSPHLQYMCGIGTLPELPSMKSRAIGIGWMVGQLKTARPRYSTSTAIKS